MSVGGRSLILLLLALGVVGVGGCSQQVRIESVPSGAEVRLNGVRVGYTPIQMRLDAATWWGQGNDASIRLAGYRTVTGQLDWRYDGRHLWLVTGILLPVTQFMHAHPRMHRRPLDLYTVVLEEDLGQGPDARQLIHGRLLPTPPLARPVLAPDEEEEISSAD